jgi:polar amino acid transport system permease protein
MRMLVNSQLKRRMLHNFATLAVYAILVVAAVALVIHGAHQMQYDWQWKQIVPLLFTSDGHGGLHAGVFLAGLGVTLEIVIWAFFGAIFLGLCFALLQRSESIVGRVLARGYIEVVRNTPMLVQIFLIYFVFAPILGMDRIFSGVVALAVFEGAFACEIFRAGIEGVVRGQWDAARSLSLGKRDTYLHIVLPQAVRLVLPPLTNLTISLIKDSTLVSVIAVAELTTAARDAISSTFMVFEIWFTVAAIYLLLTTGISFCARRLETRMAAYEI